MLPKLSVDQMLMKARSYEKRDEIADAKKIYQTVLLSFPQNKRAKDRLAALNKSQKHNVIQNPPQEVIDQLIKLYNQGQFKSMAEQAQVLTEQYPQAFIIWNCLGVAHMGLCQTEEASGAFKKVTELNPNYADGFNNLGVALQEQGKLSEALDACNKGLFLKPDYVDAYYNIGNILKDQGYPDKAVEYYKKAIRLKPDYANAFNNMGIAFHDQLKFDEAIIAYNKALILNVSSADVYCNMASSLKNQGKSDEAKEALIKAILIKPYHAEAHQNLCYALLKEGKIKEGLDEYEWRWKTSKNVLKQRHFLQPIWDGKQGLTGKRILLWSEQGVGDTIMWSSCLSLVTSQAKHCILECQPKLVPLLKRSFPNVEVKAEDRRSDQQRDDFDFHLPMGSLYKNFIQDLLTNKNPDAYLVPDPNRINYWKDRLKSLGDGPYVGISWKSADMDFKRLPNYAKILELYPVLKLPNVICVNLQYTDFVNDLTKIKKELGITIHNFDDLDHFNNIDDVAALCSALDLVVSTKTTVPLISAAIGTSTKLANWRQSPWNNILLNPKGPLVDIFERDTWEPWKNVFSSIAEDIFTTTKNWSSK